MTKYEEIYQILRGRIEEGFYPVGDLLASEHRLINEFNVSRDTIRKALSLLVQSGYIQKVKGKGSIILDVHKYNVPISGVVSFKELSSAAREEFETQVIRLDKCLADEKMCHYLDLKEGAQVWVLQRIRKINGEKVILDTDVLNAELVPNLTMDIAQDSLYEYIEKQLKLNVEYAEKEITCKAITSDDMKHLDMKGFDMVVNIESRAYLANTQVFQWTISRHRPDKFIFKDFARRIKKV